MAKTTTFLCGVLALVAATILSFAFVPSTSDWEIRAVDPNRVKLAAAGIFYHSTRVNAETEIKPDQNNSGGSTSSIQLQAIWQPDEAPRSAAILATGLTGRSELFANGVPVADSRPFNFRPTGLGSNWTLASFDTRSHVTGLERLAIVMPDNVSSPSSIRLWLANKRAASDIETSLADSTTNLRQFTMVLGAVGAITATIGLLFNQMTRFFVGTLLLALCHLGRIYLPIPLGAAVSSEALVLSIGAIGLALATTTRFGERRILRVTTLGLLACAMAGWLILLAGWIGPLGYQPSLQALIFANTAALPALGIGLPLVLLIAARDAVGGLITARKAVAERDAIIGQQEAELQEQVRKQAVLEERQRFVRDMHDGVGGQLLSLLVKVRGGTVEMGDVESEVERSIADLRLVVDSLDQVGSDLATALESFRGRTSVQLSGGGIALDWHQEGPIGDWHFDARQVLSVYRVMQEAISNAVRHSDADSIKVKVKAGCPQDGSVEIVIEDNGVGFDESDVAAGRGLANMKQRATRLGGTLSLQSGEAGGTRVVLSLPSSCVRQSKPS